MISGITHVNLPIPEGTLDQAEEFYGTTLGLTSSPVPELQKGTILWYFLERLLNKCFQYLTFPKVQYRF
jgi:catechol 2,3-dioxygenase-like lactoylglutathione lyase family enzyme